MNNRTSLFIAAVFIILSLLPSPFVPCAEAMSGRRVTVGVLAYTHLALKRTGEDVQAAEYLGSIQSCAGRAATLTRGLLAFSRKQVIDPRPVGPSEIVRGLEPLLRRLIGEHIEIRTSLEDPGLTVMADSGQLDQVLMNLATNARDAMPDGGVLTIATGSVVADGSFPASHPRAVPGARYAFLAVSDTGIGIDPGDREKIFEPFFTTKEVGKGTGLGLAIAFGIVEQHRGWIDLGSTPGGGTTFTLYLPATGAVAAAQAGPAQEPVRGGTETILLAEDDPAVRGRRNRDPHRPPVLAAGIPGLWISLPNYVRFPPIGSCQALYLLVLPHDLIIDRRNETCIKY